MSAPLRQRLKCTLSRCWLSRLFRGVLFLGLCWLSGEVPFSLLWINPVLFVCEQNMEIPESIHN